jgi:hypothetical protein
LLMFILAIGHSSACSRVGVPPSSPLLSNPKARLRNLSATPTSNLPCYWMHGW